MVAVVAHSGLALILATTSALLVAGQHVRVPGCSFSDRGL
jgi:hypothetical protein